MKKRIFYLFILPATTLAQISPFIHLDQFGYQPNASKVAVLSNPEIGFNAALSYSPSSTLQVFKSDDQSVVFSGTPVTWNNGALHNASGDKGWWFDFSSVTSPGKYYIYDVQNNQKSPEFIIGSDVYNQVLKAAGRMYYYNRCNAEKPAPFAGSKWADGNNFLNPGQDSQCRYIGDENNASLEKDLSGGWFDAGDYNKYVTFTFPTLSSLLWAYRENPSAFTDNWNIPESGNGIPDLIDEIKWELDWLMKMTNPDGSTHIKVGSRNHSENISSPPSSNTIHRRYYGPTCTSASATVAAVFSLASIVFKEFPSLVAYSDSLLNKAILAFNYVLPYYNSNTLQTDCDDQSIVVADCDISADKQKDMMLAAAVYLFERTGNPFYNNFIISNYSNSTPLSTNYWGPYAMEIQDALLRYTQLPGANQPAVNTIINSFSSAVNNNWNNFFGFDSSDLYRCYVPDWTWHWGSNKVVADYGNLNFKAADMGLGNPSNLKLKASEILHYFHGVNPLGMTMLSNMYDYGAERCANEIFHLWFADGTDYDNALFSPKGPAPGFLVGGPNKFFTITSISPPANQPDMKCYKDWNTGWPENSWEITEPAIYYQASYLRLLSKFATSHSVSTDQKDNPDTAILYPNPTFDGKVYFFSFNSEIYNVQVYNSFGTLIFFKNVSTGDAVDLKSYPPGLYFFKLNNQSVIKIIKM